MPLISACGTRETLSIFGGIRQRRAYREMAINVFFFFQDRKGMNERGGRKCIKIESWFDSDSKRNGTNWLCVSRASKDETINFCFSFANKSTNNNDSMQSYIYAIEQITHFIANILHWFLQAMMVLKMLFTRQPTNDRPTYKVRNHPFTYCMRLRHSEKFGVFLWHGCCFHFRSAIFIDDIF